MPTARDIHIYVEQDDTQDALPRVVSPSGVPKLNLAGAELANIRRGEGDPIFVYAEPVAIVGLDDDGRYLIQVGKHTQMFIDPEFDNYFL